MDRAVIECCLRAAHLARQTDRPVWWRQVAFWLFGGLWVNISGRHQPRDGAARAEPGFPTKREVATEGGAVGTPWWLRRSCHSTQLASQQCTQMPQNGSKRPLSPICVHSCVPTAVHNNATVYTNAPKRLQEAVFANLCTLLRPPPTAARTTGWGHGSHDIGGPMAPVMPGCSNLRLAPPGRCRNHLLTRTHEASVFSSHFLLSWDEKMR